jgi:hypothetical protein
MTPDEPTSDLFSWSERARRYDPDTSKETARRIAIWSQCIKVLRSYAGGRELLDHDAYRLAGFPSGRTSHQRCSDLRDQGFIERTGRRGKTPSGHSGFLCQITGKGAAFLARIAPRTE